MPVSLERSRFRRVEVPLSFVVRPLRPRSLELLDGRPRLEGRSSLLEPLELVPLFEPPELPRDRFEWPLLPLPPDVRLVPLLRFELLLLRDVPLLRLELLLEELPRLELLPLECGLLSLRERWACVILENSATMENVKQIDKPIAAARWGVKYACMIRLLAESQKGENSTEDGADYTSTRAASNANGSRSAYFISPVLPAETWCSRMFVVRSVTLSGGGRDAKTVASLSRGGVNEGVETKAVVLGSPILRGCSSAV